MAHRLTARVRATLLGHADAHASTLRGLVLLLLVAVALGGTMPYFEQLLDANERPRLFAGISLIERGTFEVEGPWSQGVALGPDLALAEDGSLVPNKPPGATLVAALAWALLKLCALVLDWQPTLRAYTIFARLLGGLLPTLILATVLWRHERAWAAARAHGPGIAGSAARARVDFALLAWLTATPAWANAKLLFGHSLAACLLGVGVIVLLGNPGERLGWARAFWAGVLAGSAVLVEYTAVFAGPAIAMWLLWREPKRARVIVAAGVGALLPILALAIYQTWVFGSPWVTGYHRAAHEQFSEIHGHGLLGLQLPTSESLFEHVISPWGGLLVWAPLCLFGLFGSLHAVRATHEPSERARQMLCAALVGSLLVVLIGLEQTGGWRVGPRYFVLAMPLAVPGLVACVRELGRPGRGLGLTLILGLGLAAVFANFLAANYFPHLIPHGNPLADVLLPLATGGHAPHGLPPWLVGVVVVGLWALVLVRLRVAVGGPWWPWIAAPLLAGALTCAQVLGPASDPAADYELSQIERIWEPSASGESPASHRLRD